VLADEQVAPKVANIYTLTHHLYIQRGTTHLQYHIKRRRVDIFEIFRLKKSSTGQSMIMSKHACYPDTSKALQDGAK
jgi:hypothetical protein